MGSWRNARTDRKDSGSAAHRATLRGNEEDATSDRRAATKNAPVLTTRGSIDQQSHERAGGTSCEGHGRAQEAVDHSSDSQKLRQRFASHRNRSNPGSACSVERRQVQRSPKCYERPRPLQTEGSVASARQTGAHECAYAHGCCSGRFCLCWAEETKSSVFSTCIGYRPEECRFLLNTQLMFLKKEEELTTKDVQR